MVVQDSQGKAFEDPRGQKPWEGGDASYVRLQIMKELVDRIRAPG